MGGGELLARQEVTQLWGRPGSMKSLLMMALSGAVAHGEELAGMECAQGPVVYFDAENGPGEVHRRVHYLDLPPEHVHMFGAAGAHLVRDFAEFEAVIPGSGRSSSCSIRCAACCPAPRRTTPTRWPRRSATSSFCQALRDGRGEHSPREQAGHRLPGFERDRGRGVAELQARPRARRLRPHPALFGVREVQGRR